VERIHAGSCSAQVVKFKTGGDFAAVEFVGDAVRASNFSVEAYLTVAVLGACA